MLRAAALERARGPWRRRELAGRAVAAVGCDETIAAMLAGAGAEPAGDGPLHGVVVDAVAMSLDAMFETLKPLVPRIAPSGRVVVLGRDPSTLPDPLAAATAAAREGIVRSLAKELGRRGATAQLVTVEPGAEDRAAAIVRFVLSSRSAFVTAQPLHASMLAVARSLEHVGALGGKTALVTGAAHGIGAATACRLAEEGAHVVCVDRAADEVAVAAVARAIHGSLLIADVRDADAPRRIAEHLRARHGGVDVIVHSAGITRDRTLANMTPAEWREVIATNLEAVVDITSALLGTVRDGGRIVCLSSVSGIAGNVGQTSYAASKAALIGYVRALARLLAPRGITANAVAPGFIETRMTAAMPLVVKTAARRLSALGQGGQPGDVAEVIAFLAQPASAGLSGEVIRVCGGALIGA